MIKVAIIGRGNVSHHLEKAFLANEKIEVTVFSSRDDLAKKIEFTDLCIIAVSDAAIVEVAKNLLSINTLVAHTSGSVSINELPNNRKGVFYPLQTFSKGKKIDFSIVPICLEAKNIQDFKLLEILANEISNSVQKVSSAQRRSLHLAAIFANNFTNHLFHITQEICEENDLSFELMKPLIVETANKIKTLTPFAAQTGPAKRHDLTTINDHEKLLQNSGHKKLYVHLTQSILDTYGQKL